jgi:hypothetical protein
MTELDDLLIPSARQNRHVARQQMMILLEDCQWRQVADCLECQGLAKAEIGAWLQRTAIAKRCF